jgi:RsiW-degrading membrane proteinase PrsW (M82 family)
MFEILIPAAFIPLIFLFIWVRNHEKYKKQSWTSIVVVFIWGSTFAIGISIVFEEIVSINLPNFFILSVFIAPLIEEIAKLVGLRFVKRNIVEFEDGLIYGAVAGFGFAATENLIYGSMYWSQGLIVILALFYLRTIGTSLLHASSTAISGLGYSNKILKKQSILSVIPYILLSITIHSIFNLFSYSALVIHQIIGVVTAVMFSFILFIFIRKQIIVLDRNGSD